MTQEDIIKMAKQAGLLPIDIGPTIETWQMRRKEESLVRFAELVAAHERKVFIEILETYRIPVGNSRSGELACEWTYRALHEIRDEIKARGEQ